MLNHVPASNRRRTQQTSALVLLFAGVAMFALLDGTVAAAATEPHGEIAAVLLMDSSGSMKRTDPQRLRVPAAQLLLSLLDAGDRAGVVSFSDQGYPVVPLTSIDTETRQRLLAGAEKVSSKGAYTNLYAALETGLALFTDADDTPRYLILLSDGRMDTGDAQRDQTLTARISADLVPALKKHDIKVYSIAFTHESDVELLQSISAKTDGLFQLIAAQSGLHDAFADIFENAKAPNMLAVDEGRFHVDGSVREITVVAPHQESEVSLRDPSGNELQYRAHPGPVRWMHSPRFDLITISAPAAGDWTLVTDSPGNRAYIVTDLKLVTDLEHDQMQLGQTLALRAWLTDKGERLQKPEVLSSTEFLLELAWSDGSHQTIALSAPGVDAVATAKVPLTQQGTVQLTLHARSTTFERQVRHRIRVIAAADEPAEATPTFIPPPIELSIPAPSAATSPIRQSEPAAATPTEPTADSATTPSPEATDHDPVDFTRVLLLFAVANAALAIVIGGVLLILARRRKAAAGRESQPTED